MSLVASSLRPLERVLSIGIRFAPQELSMPP